MGLSVNSLIKCLRMSTNSIKRRISLKFTQVYKVDIALTVGGYALRHFDEMMEMIKKQNDPIEYLKVPFFNTLKSQYCQIGKEKTAADNLCYLLRKPIVTAVTGSLGHMVAGDMMGLPIFCSKRALKCHILFDLGEKSSFESFVFYLTNAKASLQQWVKLYTEQHCAQVVGGKSRLEELSETKLHQVIASITEACCVKIMFTLYETMLIIILFLNSY